MSGKQNRESESDLLDSNNRARSGSSRSVSVSNIVRKLSHRAIKKNSNGNKSGNSIPPHCKFKLVVQTVKPELTVCFMLANTPGYALTWNKTDEMFAEKVVNDVKFCKFSNLLASNFFIHFEHLKVFNAKIRLKAKY